METESDNFDSYYSSRIKTFFASEFVKRKFEFERSIDEYNWLIKEWDFVINEIGEDVCNSLEYEFDILSKDIFIMILLNKYRLDKIEAKGLWYSNDKEEYLYNYIKNKYNNWIEKYI